MYAAERPRTPRAIPTRLIFVVAAALVTVLLAAPLAAAQTTVQVNVPFAFTVSDTTLPAGDYLLTEVDQLNTSTFALTSEEHGVEVLVPTTPSGETADLANGNLVFDTVGDWAFLTEVNLPGQGMSREVLPGDRYESLSDQELQRMEERVVTVVVVD